MLQLQTAITKYRQGKAGWDDVQATFDACADKIWRSTTSSSSGSTSGSSSGPHVQPGDMVLVPKMGVVNPFLGKVAKVRGCGGRMCVRVLMTRRAGLTA